MMDFASLFEFSVDPLELVLRGTLVYWFLFLLFRIVLRRDVGAIGIADVLVLVLVADAAQNAMAGGYESVTDGFILVGTIAAWNYAFDWATFRFAAVRRILEPKPLELIRNGKVLRSNMRREFVTMDELNSKLRQQGIEDLAEVKRAAMEPDGDISIIKRDGSSSDNTPKGKAAVV
jgi:uncharacterized membrane protein YcaP (DUF421 family)